MSLLPIFLLIFIIHDIGELIDVADVEVETLER